MQHLYTTATLLLERHHTLIHISMAMGGDIITQIPNGSISNIQCPDTHRVPDPLFHTLLCIYIDSNQLILRGEMRCQRVDHEKFEINE